MESLSVIGTRCEKLRWKGMFVQAVWEDPTVQHSDDRAFWCQHTFKCLGPDGQAVGEEECVAGRGCFEEL
ncbi:MAG: hypothetical protein ABSE35_07580 [Bryobacteraceae bacterium]